MKKFVSPLLALVLCCSAFARNQSDAKAAASDPRMTREERARAIKMLVDTQKEFLDAVENLSDAQWNYRPSPFRWSVGLVAEHIVLTQERLFLIVERSLTQKPNPDWESKTAGKEELLERVLPNRTGRAQAPVEVRPSGKLSRDEVIKRFKQARVKIMEFAEKTDLPLKAHTFDNPFPVFNTLNAYDWLLYIPLHTTRHNKQIAEVKATPGYPK
jgi:DinB superfamily